MSEIKAAAYALLEVTSPDGQTMDVRLEVAREYRGVMESTIYTEQTGFEDAVTIHPGANVAVYDVDGEVIASAQLRQTGSITVEPPALLSVSFTSRLERN